jgi:hypothetical protein
VRIGRVPTPSLAVPQSFKVTEVLPGGSSEGFKAADPGDPKYTVTVWDNACVGCYEPAFLDQGVTAITTPYSYGPPTARGVTPLPHNAVLVAQGSTWQLIIDPPSGGDIRITITDAAKHPETTKTILNSVWYP